MRRRTFLSGTASAAALTGLGVGDHEDIVRPDGARPGDDIVVTTGPAPGRF